MRSASGRLVLIFALFFGASLCAQQRLTAGEAKAHVGQQATVCGKAVGVHYAAGSRGQPTFINLDQPYPNQVFTILIWGSDRARFGNPEQQYSYRNLCATGIISTYRGVPEIIVHDRTAIKVQ
jgi:hypothetical protein